MVFFSYCTGDILENQRNKYIENKRLERDIMQTKHKRLGVAVLTIDVLDCKTTAGFLEIKDVL